MWCNLQKYIVSDFFLESKYNAEINFINTPSSTGTVPLHLAVLSSKANKIVPYLIKNGANINHANEYGETPLFWAVKTGDSHIVKLLIQANANIFLKDGDNNSLLHWAAEYNHSKIIALLISEGLTKSLKNNQNKTPYEVAKENESKDAMNFLKKQTYIPKLKRALSAVLPSTNNSIY